METTTNTFSRAELLLGREGLERIANKRVLLLGVGGVGSWCAEGLVRSGFRHLTMVDADQVNPSNINRQLMATTETIGQPKVEVLRQRLLTINPDANIIAVKKLFTDDTANDFMLDDYDYIIDAIDSLKDKAALILLACQTKATLYSSMGAALKLNPARIKTAEFWKVEGDPLARALRKRFKAMQRFPEKKFLCVYSDELLQNKLLDNCDIPHVNEQSDAPPKAHVNGSLVHITAIFGFTLASMVIQDAIIPPPALK